MNIPFFRVASNCEIGVFTPKVQARPCQRPEKIQDGANSRGKGRHQFLPWRFHDERLRSLRGFGWRAGDAAKDLRLFDNGEFFRGRESFAYGLKSPK